MDVARAAFIEDEALRLLRQTDSLRVPVSARQVAQRLGMDLSLATFKVAGLSGALQVLANRRTHIWVNRLEAPTRQRFTIAHEIGHWTLHLPDPRVFSERAEAIDAELTAYRLDGGPYGPEEQEANRFAAALLMPLPLLQEWTLQFPTGTAEAFAASLKVSVRAMEIRLRDARMA